MKEILNYLKDRFGVGRLQLLTEDFGTITDNKEVEIINKLSVYYFNSGEVTAIINGTQPIYPGAAFADGNPFGYVFNANQKLTFDDSNTFGKNEGTTKRVSTVIKKYSEE